MTLTNRYLPVQTTDFDWAYIYYVGRNIIVLSEEEFWNSSIEKINELVEVHGAINDEKLNRKRQKKMAKRKAKNIGNVFVDQVSFL